MKAERWGVQAPNYDLCRLWNTWYLCSRVRTTREPTSTSLDGILHSTWIFEEQRYVWFSTFWMEVWHSTSTLSLWLEMCGAQPKDLTGIQQCNLENLPENYHMKFCESILVSWNAIPIAIFVGAFSSIMWPEVSFLAEDSSGRVVGYVLSSVCVKVKCLWPTH